MCVVHGAEGGKRAERSEGAFTAKHSASAAHGARECTPLQTDRKQCHFKKQCWCGAQSKGMHATSTTVKAQLHYSARTAHRARECTPLHTHCKRGHFHTVPVRRREHRNARHFKHSEGATSLQCQNGAQSKKMNNASRHKAPVQMTHQERQNLAIRRRQLERGILQAT